MTVPFDVSEKIAYVLLWFAVIVVPRALQRFAIPGAVTALVLGVVAGPATGLLVQDNTVDLLSTVGIVALFLFAGLDIEPGDLRRNAQVLGEHLSVRVGALTLVAVAAATALDLTWRPATIFSLAVLTPSTGFILDSLDSWPLTADQRYWVRAKAIAAELLSLGLLFIVLQSTSPERLGVSTLVMATMVWGLPHVFGLYARFVLPFAPRTEFAFLMMTALLCSLVTRKLGVYYLVGAFVVGLAAQRARRKHPALSSERMLHTIESFGSLFIPFYFFYAGATLPVAALQWQALLAGVGLMLVFVPMRLGLIMAHRHVRLREALPQAKPVAVALMPSLVFTLVLARILADSFHLSEVLVGALAMYAVLTTLVPPIAMRGASLPQFGPADADSEELVAVRPDQ